MILIVQKHFDKLEAQRRDLLEEARKLRPEQLIFRPTPESWCILEIFDHLMVAETNGLRYMLKKIQGLESIEKTDVFASIRSNVLNLFLKLPLKYKAPPAAAIKRREYYDLEEIVAEWDELREQYREFVDNFDIPTSGKLIFKHPMAGKLTIIQALDFQYEHVAHHLPQIERIKAHEDYPK